MLMGTAGTFLAIATGEAAGEVADRTAAMNAVLEHHEDLAETTRIIFSVLTVIFAAILFLPRLLKRELTTAVARILPVAFLLLYGAGTIVLVNTAHNGGRLVHELGIHAGLAQTTGGESSPASTGGTAEEAEKE